ncbi:MAG: flagellar FliJ family protein [Phycisphaeraceae bacterium]|nr:flagellar FliJ family protein [Phycisphaeraceae bacterium]
MSRRFEFELQAVLEQRCREERRAQALLAHVEAERLRVEASIQEIARSVDAEREAARAWMTGRVPAASLRDRVAGELGADRRARALAVQLAGVRRRLESARGLLREASVRREALDRLRHKRWREWLDTLEKAEQREFDDLMVMRRGRVDGAEG